jgi:hypothetical protein
MNTVCTVWIRPPFGIGEPKEGTLSYTRTVKGDDTKMSIAFGDGGMPPMESTLKRSQ